MATTDIKSLEVAIADTKSEGSLYPLSEATTAGASSITLPASVDFNPTSALQVKSPGIRAFRLPLPPKELEIPLFTPSGHLRFVSVRESRGSGNCTLIAVDPNGSRTEVARTVYKFGPGRSPVVTLIRDDGEHEVEIKSKSLVSRATRFDTPTGTYEWRYGRKKEREPVTAKNLLILEKISLATSTPIHTEEKVKAGRRRVAQMVRNDETRAEGSSRCSAGNGGRLDLDLGEQVEEEMVVATLLVMLKKEVDRRRMIQAMTISAAIAGGSS
jgi:hypothetical protein